MNQGDLLTFYQNELKRSKNWRNSSTTNYDDEWRRYVELYQGRYLAGAPSTDQLVINMVFSTVNTMLPAVAINYPRFVVNARNPESAATAIITEEVLNWLWRAYDYQREFRLACVDWIIAGHGWVKCGYKWTKPPEEKKAESPAATEGSEEGIDDREDKDGNVESELMQWDEDRPFIERISVFDMFVDPDARHPKEMRWIAQRTWRPVQDVQVDSRYSATNRRRATGTTWSRWDQSSSSGGGDSRSSDEKPSQGAVTYCEVIEFYDLKRYKVSTFVAQNSDNAEGGDAGFLIKPAKMPYAFGHPFVMLRNYEVPDHFYPIGDVAQIESLQLELNETRTQMFNYRKKFRRAWLYAQDRFDSDGVKALESDKDNVMIPTQGDANPSDAMAPVPAVMTPPEFFDQSAMIANDIDRVSGVSDYQRGAPQQQIKRTATEAAMIQDASNSRAQDRLAKIEGVLSEIAERIVGLMQQFTTGDQVARVVTMPVRAWVNFDADRVRGQFDYEVQGGSTEPRNETFRRQSALQMVDSMTPFMQAGVINMPAFAQELLQKGFGVKDAGRFIQQPPPPAPPPGGPEGAAPPPGMEQGAPAPGMPQELTPEMLAAMMQTGGPPGAPPVGPPAEQLPAPAY